MTVTISKHFVDYDNRLVREGEYEGATIERMGHSEGRGWFWNILHKGHVVAVTLGYPPNSKHEESAND